MLGFLSTALEMNQCDFCNSHSSFNHPADLHIYAQLQSVLTINLNIQLLVYLNP